MNSRYQGAGFQYSCVKCWIGKSKWYISGRCQPFKAPWKAKEMRRCSTFRFFYSLFKYIAQTWLSLPLFFTWSLLFAGSPHHERPVDPRVEADVVEGVRKPEKGRDRDATLWQLWYWWCCPPGKFCEIRAKPGVARPRHTPPPTLATDKYFLRPKKKKTAGRPLDQGFNVRRNIKGTNMPSLWFENKVLAAAAPVSFDPWAPNCKEWTYKNKFTLTQLFLKKLGMWLFGLVLTWVIEVTKIPYLFFFLVSPACYIKLLFRLCSILSMCLLHC